MIYLFLGVIMLGVFFIVIDLVSVSMMDKGCLIYGFFIGVMVFLICSWGGFFDGVVFVVLFVNMCVLLIDYYIKLRIYGY